MNAEMEKTMKYLQSQLSDPNVAGRVMEYIVCLESEKQRWEMEYQCTYNKLKQTDYHLQNEKKANENNKKAMEGFVKENKALRELVSLWA